MELVLRVRVDESGIDHHVGNEDVSAVLFGANVTRESIDLVWIRGCNGIGAEYVVGSFIK